MCCQVQVCTFRTLQIVTEGLTDNSIGLRSKYSHEWLPAPVLGYFPDAFSLHSLHFTSSFSLGAKKAKLLLNNICDEGEHVWHSTIYMEYRSRMQRALPQGGNHLHVLTFRRLHDYTRNSSVHFVLTLWLRSRLASTVASLMLFSEQFIYVAMFFFPMSSQHAWLICRVFSMSPTNYPRLVPGTLALD